MGFRYAVALLLPLPLVALHCEPFTASAPMGVDGGGAGDGGDTGRADASGDAPQQTDGGLAFCATKPTAPRICTTFDTLPLAQGWTTSEEVGDATINAGAPNYPGTFVAKAPLNCNDGTHAQLIDRAPGKPELAEVEFDLSIAPLATTIGMNLAGITYEADDSAGYFRVDLLFRNGALIFTRNGADGFVALPGEAAFPFDTTKRVNVAFDFKNNKLLLKIDGVVAIDQSFGFTPPDPSTNDTQLDFGIYISPKCKTAVEVRFDNLAYWLTTR